MLKQAYVNIMRATQGALRKVGVETRPDRPGRGPVPSRSSMMSTRSSRSIARGGPTTPLTEWLISWKRERLACSSGAREHLPSGCLGGAAQ